MQDLLVENVKEGNFLSIDGKLQITDKVGENPEEKYYLSEKLKKYVNKVFMNNALDDYII